MVYGPYLVPKSGEPIACQKGRGNPSKNAPKTGADLFVVPARAYQQTGADLFVVPARAYQRPIVLFVSISNIASRPRM